MYLKMANLFPLSSMLFSYVTSAVRYKLQSVEQKARHNMQLSSTYNEVSDSSVEKNRIVNRIEPIIECLESLLKSFLGCGYNAGLALLVTIPAVINKNSQPLFPNVKIFWKRRLCHAGISLGIGFAKVLVLTKITGLIYLIGSVICYCKSSFRPTFQKIDKMSGADIDFAIATALSGMVVANVDQKNMIDKISSFTTLVLYCAKPIAVGMLTKAHKLMDPMSVDQKALEKIYDKKCCELIHHLDASNNVHEIKDHIFHLYKDGFIQAINTCDVKASIILKCVVESIKNVFAETAPAISCYYQTQFSCVKNSLESAKNGQEITRAVKDFSIAIKEIFNGLKTAITYEKNFCMNKIACSLQTQEEEFEDALDDQEWL